MQTRTPRQQIAPLRRLISLLLASLALYAMKPQVHAEDFTVRVSFASGQKQAVALNLMVGQSRMIQFDQEIGRLSVSNPEIAEAVIVAGDQVVVNGKTFGHVNFIAWDKSNERPVIFDVAVRINLTLMDSLLRDLFPEDKIFLNQANGSIVLTGSVSDNRKIAMADNAVQAAGFKTVNLIRGPFKESTQVQLQVQVAEVNRSKVRDLGVAFLYQATAGQGAYVNGGGGPASIQSVIDGIITGTLGSSLNVLFLGGHFDAFIRALQTNGALRTLAEPNIVALDGAEASFLAGGEFPVPIVQGSGNASQVTIVFKEFGIRLTFKPIVLDGDHLRLELQPEVSTLDFANGVLLQDFRIPALRTRRAKTSVELKNHEGFALAGLLDTTELRTLSKIPFLGDIPWVGNLFKSENLQKQETELIFIIKANIVKVGDPQAVPQLPGLDGLKSSKSPLTKTPPPPKVEKDDSDKKKSENSKPKGEASEPTQSPSVSDPSAASPAKPPGTGSPLISVPGSSAGH